MNATTPSEARLRKMQKVCTNSGTLDDIFAVVGPCTLKPTNGVPLLIKRSGSPLSMSLSPNVIVPDEGAQKALSTCGPSEALPLLLPQSDLSDIILRIEITNRRYYLIPWIVWVSASCIILIILWCLRAIIAIKDQVFAACNEPVRYQETNVDTSTLIYGLHSQVNATAL
ncbi:hypothetical protein MRX96_028086 [Rhipicephalus microplus]